MPNGARSSSCIFFSGSRSMAAGDHVDRAVGQSGNAGLDVLGRAERRIELVVGVERAQRFVGQREVDGTHAGGDRNVPVLAAAHQVDADRRSIR